MIQRRLQPFFAHKKGKRKHIERHPISVSTPSSYPHFSLSQHFIAHCTVTLVLDADACRVHTVVVVVMVVVMVVVVVVAKGAG